MANREQNPFRSPSLIHPELAAKIEQATASRDGERVLGRGVISKLMTHGHDIPTEFADMEARVRSQFKVAMSGYREYRDHVDYASEPYASMETAQRVLDYAMERWRQSGAFEYIDAKMMDDPKLLFHLVAIPNYDVMPADVKGALEAFAEDQQYAVIDNDSLLWAELGQGYTLEQRSGTELILDDGTIPPVRFSLMPNRATERIACESGLNGQRTAVLRAMVNSLDLGLYLPPPHEAVAELYALRQYRRQELRDSQAPLTPRDEIVATTFINMPDRLDAIGLDIVVPRIALEEGHLTVSEATGAFSDNELRLAIGS